MYWAYMSRFWYPEGCSCGLCKLNPAVPHGRSAPAPAASKGTSCWAKLSCERGWVHHWQGRTAAQQQQGKRSEKCERSSHATLRVVQEDRRCSRCRAAAPCSPGEAHEGAGCCHAATEEPTVQQWLRPEVFVLFFTTQLYFNWQENNLPQVTSVLLVVVTGTLSPCLYH